MNQKIVCRMGTCFEEGTWETEFDSIFDKTNIVEQIRRDIIMNMVK